MEKLLLVEDDLALGQGVRLALQTEDRPVTLCRTLAQARQVLEGEGPFALAILDVNLPDGSGLTFLEEVRGRLPVILLTANDWETDIVAGLELGAEDYITKPFETLELLARVEVVLRRRGGGVRVLTYGPIVQNLDSHTVTVHGELVSLAPKEFELLRVFLQHQDLALSRERLLSMVWGYEFQGESRTVDIHVQRLRQKLGLSQSLVTLPRIGYRLEKQG